MDSKTLPILKDMLSIINVKFDKLEQLIDIEILRSDLLSEDVINHFDKFKDSIKNLGYKTGNLTSLHKNNKIKQSWPSINILRQILKCNKLHLKPFVKSNGYDKDNGKKKIIRYFVIKNIKS